MSCSASYSGRMYGLTFSSESPGEEPEPLAGLDGRAREDDAPTCAPRAPRPSAIARYVLPVPAGPIPNETVLPRIAIDVLRFLSDRLRRDLLAPVAPDDVVEDVPAVGGLVERAEHRIDSRRPNLCLPSTSSTSSSSTRAPPRRRCRRPRAYGCRAGGSCRAAGRGATGTPSPIPASSAATSFDESVCCVTTEVVGRTNRRGFGAERPDTALVGRSPGAQGGGWPNCPTQLGGEMLSPRRAFRERVGSPWSRRLDLAEVLRHHVGHHAT